MVAIDTRHPMPKAWRDVVAESADAIEVASYIGGKIVVTYLHDAHSQVNIF